MKNRLEIIKSELMRAKLRVVKVSETTLQESADRNDIQFDNHYVDAPYVNMIIDDLKDLDLSTPWAVKRVKYRGKYLR